jgi:N-acetylmuramoyl-L-alanine amidase-like protein
VNARAGWARAEWPLQLLVVHHTAYPEPLGDPTQAVARIRHLHAVENGWGDIGYGFLVDPAGTVHEGRSTRLSPPGHAPAGAHAEGHNAGTLGIALLGTFTADEPTVAARDALAALLAAECARAGLDPTGAVDYVNPVSGLERPGLPAICGHRDLIDTECPGDALYALLPEMRLAAQAHASGGASHGAPRGG